MPQSPPLHVCSTFFLEWLRLHNDISKRIDRSVGMQLLSCALHGTIDLAESAGILKKIACSLETLATRSGAVAWRRSM